MVSLIASESLVSYQCLNGKGCTFVQNISSYEEAKFRNVLFDGSSYYAYSQNDCYGGEPYWVSVTKTIRGNRFFFSLTIPNEFWYVESLRPYASYERYQCLPGKDCTTVQNIPSFEEAEFRNMQAVGRDRGA